MRDGNGNEREKGGQREREQEGEVWRECGSKRRGERKQSLTLLTVTSLVYEPTRGYGICKKTRWLFSCYIYCKQLWSLQRKTIGGEQIELGKGGGELGEMKDRTRQESRKYFFMIWNENISLDQSVIARGGGGGRETCKGYFRLTDWLIGLLWGRHADMLFRATVIAIAFLLLIIYSIIPRSTASQKPKVMSLDPTLRVWSWFGFLV